MKHSQDYSLIFFICYLCIISFIARKMIRSILNSARSYALIDNIFNKTVNQIVRVIEDTSMNKDRIHQNQIEEISRIRSNMLMQERKEAEETKHQINVAKDAAVIDLLNEYDRVLRRRAEKLYAAIWEDELLEILSVLLDADISHVQDNIVDESSIEEQCL